MSALIPYDDNSNRTPAQSSVEDYVSLLTRFMQNGAQDPSVMRAVVYEVMRTKLKRAIGSQLSTMGVDAARAHLHALENAILQVELSAAHAEVLTEEILTQQLSQPALPRPGPVEDPDLPMVIDSPRHFRPVETAENASVEAPARPKQELFSLIARTGLATAALMAGVYALTRPTLPVRMEAISSSQQLESKPVVQNTSASNTRSLEVASTDGNHQATRAPVDPGNDSPASALPSGFGTFAAVDGKLYKLEPLPLRLPDERVQIGPVIKSEAKTRIPAGQIEFIVHRRELIANTPDRAVLRVISKIHGAVSYEGGKANRVAIDNEWAVRNKTYDLAVYPVPNDQQKIMLRPANPDTILPAGRYALVLKDQTFDLEIYGGKPDPDQCLERFQSANGVVYVACKS